MTSTQQKQWFAKVPGANLNPMSPQSDTYCEKLYKSFIDTSSGPPNSGNLVFQDKVLRACELLDIDIKEIMPR